MSYQISVGITFPAQHAIRLDDGRMEPYHDHAWQVRVTVGCLELDRIETVMDFHALEAWLDQTVSPVRNCCFNDFPPFAHASGELAINPTAERIAWWIAQELGHRLPDRVSLVSVAVTESPGCQAIYFPPPPLPPLTYP